MSDKWYVTVNYLFATYLQTKEAGSLPVLRVEKIRDGKAKFFFEITETQAEDLKVKWANSSCSEFERLRRHTIELAY